MYNRKKQDLVDSMMLDLQLAMCDWFWPLRWRQEVGLVSWSRSKNAQGTLSEKLSIFGPTGIVC